MDTITAVNVDALISPLLGLATRAHSGTSFSPDVRGRNMISAAIKELSDDLIALDCQGATTEAMQDYADRYKRLFSNWLSAKSSCISTMITGGSNFPVRRAEKANRSEHRHYEIFSEWRHRAQKSIIRKMQPPRTVATDLEDARKNLNERIEQQVFMKRINDAHTKYCKAPDKFDFEGFTDKERTLIAGFVAPYTWAPHPFAPYQLSNNNANINRLKERVKMLEAKQAKQAETPQRTAITGNGWELIENNEMDRYQIIFEGKPAENIRTILKKNGFKWAPSQSAWQRQITANARFTMKHYLLPELIEATKVN